MSDQRRLIRLTFHLNGRSWVQFMSIAVTPFPHIVQCPKAEKRERDEPREQALAFSPDRSEHSEYGQCNEHFGEVGELLLHLTLDTGHSDVMVQPIDLFGIASEVVRVDLDRETFRILRGL